MIKGQAYIKLANGAGQVPIIENMYSAFIVDPGSSNQWEVFTYGRGQTIPSVVRGIADFIHTNVPRSGVDGLPREWEMFVHAWRATLNQPLIKVVADWAAHVELCFVYDNKEVHRTYLSQLLHGSVPIKPLYALDQLPVHMKDMKAFSVQINEPTQYKIQRDQLDAWLRSDKAFEPMLTCWIYLEGQMIRVVV